MSRVNQSQALKLSIEHGSASTWFPHHAFNGHKAASGWAVESLSCANAIGRVNSCPFSLLCLLLLEVGRACSRQFYTSLATKYRFVSVTTMAYPEIDDRQRIAGSCPCSCVSWICTTFPSSVTICHCAQCRSVSSTNAPIAYSSLPNDSLHFSDGAAPSVSATSNFAAAYTPNIACTETERAVRGTCKHCGTLIYMKYHCSPESTDMNMGLCSDESVLRRVRDATDHIFFKGQVRTGEKAWRGFSDELSEAVAKWEREGKMRRADV